MWYFVPIYREKKTSFILNNPLLLDIGAIVRFLGDQAA